MEPYFNCECCCDADGGCDDCNGYEEVKNGESKSDYKVVKSGEYTIYTNLLSQKAQTKEEQQKDLINIGLLPLARNQLNMISSAGGGYKSFVALRSAMRYTVTEDKKALCLFTEDTTQQVVNRLHQLKGYEPEFDESELGVMSVDSNCPENITEITNLINDSKEYIGLIVLDPLLAFYTDEENDNTKAKKFMNKLVKACRKSDMTLLILHHSAKGAGNSRGAGAFTDACRVVYHRSINEDIVAEDRANGTATFELFKDNIGIQYLSGDNSFSIQVSNGYDDGKL